MKINFFLNYGCAIVYCISRLSLLDMKSISYYETALFHFEIVFSDILIFLIPKGLGRGDIIYFFLVPNVNVLSFMVNIYGLDISL